MTIRKTMLAGLALALLATGPAGAAQTLDAYLQQGQPEAAAQAFAKPHNDAERFSLAVAQVMVGVQEFSAGLDGLGLKPDSPLTFLPFFRIAMPGAQRGPGDPLPVATPAAVRHHFQSLRNSLRKANETLAKMKGDDFGVTVDLSRIHLDFDGNGRIEEHELLLGSLAEMMRAPSGGQALIIRFDAADASWLRGYTHFLCGFLDILLAYDWRPVWDQCAHQLFLAPDPYPPLQQWVDSGDGFETWIDLIAAVHVMHLEPVDDQAWPRARREFEAMFDDSRRCWAQVLAETDNRDEWLPSPDQTGPGGATIRQEEIDAWLAVLDEMDAILRGEKLLPHARLRPGAGINVDKLIESPPPLDLVLWVQGSALLPYLEQGEVSDSGRWDALTAPFGPGFLRFAIWSN